MYIVVLVTAANLDESQKIGRRLIEQKLAACVNIVENIKSIYWWQGKVDQSQEVLMVIKTKKSLFKKLMATVKSLHSYTVPEIIALPITDGNKDYLNWIRDSVVNKGIG